MTVLVKSEPVIILLAGLIGAAGVGLAAAATHTGASLLGPASAMCLAHAPAMFALLALSGKMRTARLAALVIGIGTLLFAGDLCVKQFYGFSLFPMAAPLGGIIMIAGWLIAALGSVLRGVRG